MKTMRFLLAFTLGVALSATTTRLYAQTAGGGVPSGGTGTGGTPGFGTPTQGFGTTQPQSMNAQGATPTGTNQATALRQGTGKQPSLIGSAAVVSVLGANGTRAIDLGFIGADTLNYDYYNPGSYISAQAEGGGGGAANRGTNRNSTANRGTTGAGAARQTRAQTQQRNNTTGGANSQQPKTTVRAALRSEISIQPQTVAAYTSRFQSRMTRLPALERFNDRVQVSVSGRTATLRGTVNSKREAEMLAKLTMMEAGISAVDNQLVVRSARTP
jgi:hypothetical protein